MQSPYFSPLLILLILLSSFPFSPLITSAPCLINPRLALKEHNYGPHSSLLTPATDAYLNKSSDKTLHEYYNPNIQMENASSKARQSSPAHVLKNRSYVVHNSKQYFSPQYVRKGARSTSDMPLPHGISMVKPETTTHHRPLDSPQKWPALLFRDAIFDFSVSLNSLSCALRLPAMTNLDIFLDLQ